MVIGNRYGPGKGRILFRNVQCIGNETSIAECDHNNNNANYYFGGAAQYCNHSEDVSVSCGRSPVQYGKFNSNDSHCQSLNKH